TQQPKLALREGAVPARHDWLTRCLSAHDECLAAAACAHHVAPRLEALQLAREVSHSAVTEVRQLSGMLPTRSLADLDRHACPTRRLELHRAREAHFVLVRQAPDVELHLELVSALNHAAIADGHRLGIRLAHSAASF